jgi:hypothetical protein
MEKTANQKWRESGSTLTFKEWIDRENQKKGSTENFLSFDSIDVKSDFSDTIKNEINVFEDDYPIKNKVDKGKFLGLDTTTLIVSTILIVSSVGYYLSKRKKK